ncbi:MAG: NAD-dependent epimerase/dehydratase family protein, partial [Solirubrobacterales bacterium]|nr:NAD-dependent epimerase/dehydratase family protein [Solirubrobacterales bacterium]
MPQARKSGSGRSSSQLKVAITGPTGDIGRSLLRALDRSREVKEIRAMARRPFDPAEAGLKKTTYRQGDVMDRESIDELVKGTDVVIHLAFLILGDLEDTQRTNLEGSRNVFEAAVAAGAKRLIYASSVAAYGFHADNPSPLTEEVAPRGTDRHYYSAQKAQLEGALEQVLAGSATDAYVFRPCIVAGPDALLLLQNIPYVQMSERMPGPMRRVLELMPALRPVLPDPGVPFQLVHHDDVATAMRAAVLGRGEPGVYNLAAEGTLTMSNLADALGWYSVPLPE